MIKINKKLIFILAMPILIILIIAFRMTTRNLPKESSKFTGFSNVIASSIDGMIVTKEGNILKLSVDNGKTFTKSLDIEEVGVIKHIFLFKNGELLIGNHTKLYYSYDWVKLTESSVVGIDGEPYVPAPYENFSTYSKDINRQIIDGKELLVWGNYSIQSGTQYENINVWYTTDKGKTVKSAFKYGVLVPLNNDDLPLQGRHVHDVNFNPADNTFWVQSGDEDTEENSHWLKGSYNIEDDTWTWKRIISGDYAKTASMVFKGDEVYWAWDVEGGGGVMKDWQFTPSFWLDEVLKANGYPDAFKPL